MTIDEKNPVEIFKAKAILKPLRNKEELRAWFTVYFGLEFPMGTVATDSTHGPIEAMWRIYELFDTGKSAEVSQVVMLASRDSFKCSKKGSLLLTPTGYCKIEDVKVGDTVWSGWNWRKVTDWIDDGEKESVDIRLRNGIELSNSPIHKHWCLRDGVEQWIMAKDITEKDLICVNTDTGLTNTNIIASQSEYDNGYFLGLLAGDGSVSAIDSSTHAHFAFTNIDPVLLEWYYNYIENTLKSKVAPSMGDKISHSTWDKRAIEKIKSMGVMSHRSWEKEIPKYCYDSHSAMIGFINGLFDTDGTFNSKNQIEIPITAKKIVYELQKVLIGYGIDARVISNKKTYQQKNGIKQNHIIHRLYINSNEHHKMFNLGFSCKAEKAGKLYKPQIYDAHDTIPYTQVKFFLDYCADNHVIIRGRKYIKPKTRGCDRGKKHKGITYGKLRDLLNWFNENRHYIGDKAEDKAIAERVESILSNKWFEFTSKESKKSHFYDLTVEEDHSYWCNGTISHNTLAASAIEVLCMLHFAFCVAHGAAVKDQSSKAIQYINSFFRKISPYLEFNGWTKVSDSKTKIEWITDKDETVYIRVLVATLAGMNCIHPDSKVITEKGEKTAEEVYGLLQSGEEVKILSYNHKKDRKEFKKIIHTEKKQHNKQFKLTTSSGKSTTTSKEHRFAVKDNYIEVDSISNGDEIIEL